MTYCAYIFVFITQWGLFDTVAHNQYVRNLTIRSNNIFFVSRNLLITKLNFSQRNCLTGILVF